MTGPTHALSRIRHYFVGRSESARYPVTRPAAFAEFVLSPDRRWVTSDDATGAAEIRAGLSG